MTDYLYNVCTYNYTERQGDGGMRKEQMKYSTEHKSEIYDLTLGKPRETSQRRTWKEEGKDLVGRREAVHSRWEGP